MSVQTLIVRDNEKSSFDSKYSNEMVFSRKSRALMSFERLELSRGNGGEACDVIEMLLRDRSLAMKERGGVKGRIPFPAWTRSCRKRAGDVV